MTAKQFQKTTRKLIAELSEKLKAEADRLYRCGGIDPERYDDDLVLPRILLTVAIENKAIDFLPLGHKTDLANLRNF